MVENQKAMPQPEMRRIRRIHFVGIGGVGHKTLTVVKPDRGEVHTQVGHPFGGPGCGPRQNVDFP